MGNLTEIVTCNCIYAYIYILPTVIWTNRHLQSHWISDAFEIMVNNFLFENIFVPLINYY